MRPGGWCYRSVRSLPGIRLGLFRLTRSTALPSISTKSAPSGGGCSAPSFDRIAHNLVHALDGKAVVSRQLGQRVTCRIASPNSGVALVFGRCIAVEGGRGQRQARIQARNKKTHRLFKGG